jgi:hypothetical protein
LSIASPEGAGSATLACHPTETGRIKQQRQEKEKNVRTRIERRKLCERRNLCGWIRQLVVASADGVGSTNLVGGGDDGGGVGDRNS